MIFDHLAFMKVSFKVNISTNIGGRNRVYMKKIFLLLDAKYFGALSRPLSIVYTAN